MKLKSVFVFMISLMLVISLKSVVGAHEYVYIPEIIIPTEIEPPIPVMSRWDKFGYVSSIGHKQVSLDIINVATDYKTSFINAVSDWNRNSDRYVKIRKIGMNERLPKKLGRSIGVIIRQSYWQEEWKDALAITTPRDSNLNYYQESDDLLSFNGRIEYADIYINHSNMTKINASNLQKQKTISHEIGHCLGFGEMQTVYGAGFCEPGNQKYENLEPDQRAYWITYNPYYPPSYTIKIPSIMWMGYLKDLNFENNHRIQQHDRDDLARKYQ